MGSGETSGGLWSNVRASVEVGDRRRTADPHEALAGPTKREAGGGERDVFLGTHFPKLDAKGRLILPARFRDDLADGLVLTKGQERCLVVWPRAEFEAYSEKLRANAQANAQVRAMTRVFFSSAFDESVDCPGPADDPAGPARLRRPRPRARRGRCRHPHRDLVVSRVGRLPRPARAVLRRASTWREVSRCPRGSRHPHHLIPLRGFDAPSPAPNRPRRPFPGAGPRRGAWCYGFTRTRPERNGSRASRGSEGPLVEFRCSRHVPRAIPQVPAR